MPFAGIGVFDGSAVTYSGASVGGMLMSGPNRANKFKRKKRSCAMCKPNKTGGAHRFHDKERAVRRDPPQSFVLPMSADPLYR